jgi:hypothetical protein
MREMKKTSLLVMSEALSLPQKSKANTISLGHPGALPKN